MSANDCPRCGARAGEGCKTSLGGYLQPWEQHLERSVDGLNLCQCGSAEIAAKPNSDVGFVCAGCGVAL